MTYTVDDAHKWIEENQQDLQRSLAESKEVPPPMKAIPQISKLWNAGCWLAEMLEEAGASEEENHDICFAHGQCCFGGNALEEAVRLLNEFVATGTTEDRPGPELAEKINERFN